MEGEIVKPTSSACPFQFPWYRFVGAKRLRRADSHTVTYDKWQSESFADISTAPFPFGDGAVVFGPARLASFLWFLSGSSRRVALRGCRLMPWLGFWSGAAEAGPPENALEAEAEDRWRRDSVESSRRRQPSVFRSDGFASVLGHGTRWGAHRSAGGSHLVRSPRARFSSISSRV